jgi:hypothetical protein
MVRMFEHIRTYAKFYRVMLGRNGDPSFAEKIRQYVWKRIRRSLPEALLRDRKSAELHLSYIASGSVGVMLWWLENDMPYTPAEMAALAYRFSGAYVNAVTGKGGSQQPAV